MSFKPLACALLLLPAGALAGDTVAVLSSGGGAYQDSLSAFQRAYGEEVPGVELAELKPLQAGTKVVVAFGGKAAVQDYPPGTDLVYVIAPGVFIHRPPGQGQAVKVAMVPDPSRLLRKLKEIHPGLKRLTAFRMVPGFADYLDQLAKAGAAEGVAVEPVRVESAAALPALLRRGLARMDAFWVPPDPLLVSAETLKIFRDFSLDNGIPMYASTRGLAREGAAASVGVSFAESGAAAATAALAVRRGENLAEVLFPEKTELTLNASSARRCGVRFTRKLLDEAERIFP